MKMYVFVFGLIIKFIPTTVHVVCSELPGKQWVFLSPVCSSGGRAALPCS